VLEVLVAVRMGPVVLVAPFLFQDLLALRLCHDDHLWM
jgi:hypothetical protein